MNNLYPFVEVETNEESITVEWFHPTEVLMILADKKCGTIHYIGNKIYKSLYLTLEAYEEIWYSYGFRYTDKSSVTNLSKVKFYNDDLGLLYFEENPTKHSLSAPVARMRKDVVNEAKEEYGIVFLSDSSNKDHKGFNLKQTFGY